MVLSRVALTGVSGMVGQHLMTSLQNKGITCVAASRNKPTNEKNFISWRPWDLQEWKSVEELNAMFMDVSAIIHVGAAVPRPGEKLSYKTIFDSNVRSCLCLGQWALERKIPMIFLSGATVYASPDREGISEGDEKVVNGRGGFYGFSKLLAEDVLLHLAEGGLQLCILRPSSIYGFGLHPEKMISKFILQASRNETIFLEQPVDDRIDLIHAADVADAVVQALEANVRGIYNIASETLVTVLEIAQTCVEVVGKGKVMIKESVSKRPPTIRFGLDCAKAQNVFGFSSKINLCEGITTTWCQMQKNVVGEELELKGNLLFT